MTDPLATSEPQGTISSVTLICGPSGSGKSSVAATLAEYVWEVHKQFTTYYLFDSGGIPTQVQSLANKGIIRLWRVRTRSADHLAPESVYRAACGWWPKRINPLTGQVDPAVDLVPPVTQTIQCVCPNGHVAQVVRHQSLLRAGVCPTCNVQLNSGTWKLVHASKITKGFEHRGACIFDSMPGANAWLLEDLSKRNLGGEASRLGGVVESGSMRFGENNRAQVGFAQNFARQCFGAGNSIPNLVVPPVWTALLKEGDMEGLKLKGPDIEAGSAKTATIPQWVGNCIETAVVEHDGKKWRRLWLSSYIDQEGFRHPLKVRAYPGMLPEYLEDEDTIDPGQARFVNFNLGLLHKMLDQGREAYEKQLTERYPDAPGLSGASEFGEEDQVAAAGTASTPAAVKGPTAPRPAGPSPVKGPSPAPGAAPKPAGVAQPVVTAPLAPAQAAPSPIPDQVAQPSVAATGPVAPTPPVSRGPVRGPVAAPPGRRPTPVVKS